MNDTNTDTTTTTPTAPAIVAPIVAAPAASVPDYLRKFIREMHLGTVRELLGILELRYSRTLQAMEEAGTDEAAVGEGTACVRHLRKMLVDVDGMIQAVGEGFRLGDTPNYAAFEDGIAGPILEFLG